MVDLASRTPSAARPAVQPIDPSGDDDVTSPTGVLTEDHELIGVDPHDLDDVPADAVVGPVDRLLQAFPGSHEIDERS